MFQFVENNNIMLIEQYLLLLSGGAGVGKILLLKVIIKYHKRVKKYCVWNLDQPSVLVIASMVKAAN